MFVDIAVRKVVKAVQEAVEVAAVTGAPLIGTIRSRILWTQGASAALALAVQARSVAGAVPEGAEATPHPARICIG